MKAISGRPAKMRMQTEMMFERLGPNKTRVTCVMEYRVPYSVVGSFLDWLYLRRKAQEHTRNAVQGMKRAAALHRILPLQLQIEKRKLDHPGYQHTDA